MKIPNLRGYAIYDPECDLWSGGGVGPQWRKTPKVWRSIGALKNHVHQFFVTDFRNKQYVIRSEYRGCKVIDLMTGAEVPDFDIYKYLYESCEKEQKRYEKYREDFTITER